MRSSVCSGASNELPSIRWTEVGQEVWIPHWTRQAEAFATSLEPLTASSAADVATNLDSFLAGADAHTMSADEKTELAATTIACALAVSLAKNGWSVATMPGDRVRMTKEGVEIDPFGMSQKFFAQGELSREDWQAIVDNAGVSALSLSPR